MPAKKINMKRKKLDGQERPSPRFDADGIDRLKKLEQEIITLRASLQSERDKLLEECPDPMDVLVGAVAEQSVAFPVSLIQEVLPRVYLSSVPEAPAYLTGYLNWRGVPVPVIDPAARWGEAPLPVRLEDRIVVFVRPEGPRALLLSRVEQIARVSKSQLGRIPPEIPAGPYALALWYAGDRNILLISPDRLIDPAELAKYEIA